MQSGRGLGYYAVRLDADGLRRSESNVKCVGSVICHVKESGTERRNAYSGVVVESVGTAQHNRAIRCKPRRRTFDDPQIGQRYVDDQGLLNQAYRRCTTGVLTSLLEKQQWPTSVSSVSTSPHINGSFAASGSSAGR